MSKALDPFWQYGDPKDGTNRQRLNCELCGQHMTRGTSRLKYHSAKIHGNNVGNCLKSTTDIMGVAHD
jgi:hypothetical protein